MNALQLPSLSAVLKLLGSTRRAQGTVRYTVVEPGANPTEILVYAHTDRGLINMNMYRDAMWIIYCRLKFSLSHFIKLM